MTYNELEDRILEIVSLSEMATTSDVQGMVMALTLRIKREGLHDIKLKELKVGQFITIENERYLICTIKYEPQEPPLYKLLSRDMQIVWRDLS